MNAATLARRERLDASKQRPRRPIPDTCPACRAPVARDGTLAYCAARCGWFVTPGTGRAPVAAEPAVHVRTPIHTDTPEEDMTHGDTETQPDDDDDLVSDMVEDAVAPLGRKPRSKRPAAKPERRAYGEGRTLVLDAIRAGKDGYRSLHNATGLGDSSLYGALKSLEKDGLIRVSGEEKQRRYLPTEATGKPAPKKPGPKPKAKPVARKPAPTVAPAPPAPEPRSSTVADVWRLLASLSPADLDEVLGRLTPAVHSRADTLAYVRSLAV